MEEGVRRQGTGITLPLIPPSREGKHPAEVHFLLLLLEG